MGNVFESCCPTSNRELPPPVVKHESVGLMNDDGDGDQTVSSGVAVEEATSKLQAAFDKADADRATAEEEARNRAALAAEATLESLRQKRDNEDLAKLHAAAEQKLRDEESQRDKHIQELQGRLAEEERKAAELDAPKVTNLNEGQGFEQHQQQPGQTNEEPPASTYSIF